MNIIETNLNFGNLSNLGVVKRIICHNADASTCSIEDIDRWHKNNGWAGCGYHFLVRKDGSIYRGRPEDKLGAHTSNYNTGSLGICFEGKYNTEEMPETQLKAGQELIKHLLDKYKLNKSNIYKHKDFNNTDCPGHNFPWTNIINGIDGVTIDNVTVIETPANNINDTVKGDDWIRRLQQECNNQGFSKQVVDGIPGPATLAGCPTLKKGAQGNITKLLQDKLVKLGYNTNGVDGIFGSGTHSAVREFQKTRGLAVDGIVGQNTWRKLLNM